MLPCWGEDFVVGLVQIVQIDEVAWRPLFVNRCALLDLPRWAETGRIGQIEIKHALLTTELEDFVVGSQPPEFLPQIRQA